MKAKAKVKCSIKRRVKLNRIKLGDSLKLIRSCQFSTVSVFKIIGVSLHDGVHERQHRAEVT